MVPLDRREARLRLRIQYNTRDIVEANEEGIGNVIYFTGVYYSCKVSVKSNVSELSRRVDAPEQV